MIREQRYTGDRWLHQNRPRPLLSSPGTVVELRGSWCIPGKVNSWDQLRPSGKTDIDPIEKHCVI